MTREEQIAIASRDTDLALDYYDGIYAAASAASAINIQAIIDDVNAGNTHSSYQMGDRQKGIMLAALKAALKGKS